MRRVMMTMMMLIVQMVITRKLITMSMIICIQWRWHVIMTSKWSSNYRLKSFRWHNLRTLWCHKRKKWVIIVCLAREVQDLKSAIDDQTRNYRDLQVCFSKSLTILSFNLRITNCKYSNKYSARQQVRKCSLTTGTSNPCRWSSVKSAISLFTSRSSSSRSGPSSSSPLLVTILCHQEKKNEEARQKMAAVNRLREEIQVGL